MQSYLRFRKSTKATLWMMGLAMVVAIMGMGGYLSSPRKIKRLNYNCMGMMRKKQMAYLEGYVWEDLVTKRLWKSEEIMNFCIKYLSG